MLSSLDALCRRLVNNGSRTVFLIHEPYRLDEIRDFAEKLRKRGFHVFVAHDFRLKGEKAVSQAIEISDFSVVVAYDEETVRKAKKLGVDFIELRDA